MAYGPNIPPTGTGVPHDPIPDIFSPRTVAYVTPNPRVEGEVNDGVRDQIIRTLREFRFTPKGRARPYQKPYSKYFDMIPYPWGFCDRTSSGRGSSTRISLSDSQRSENTINTQTTIPIYIEV
jgi:hypothetical protein